MAEGVPLKLPGSTRRPGELTPRLDLWAAATLPLTQGTAVFVHGGNDVAYKMIGGTYGVLGAEVFGQYVPRPRAPNAGGYMCERPVSPGFAPSSCGPTLAQWRYLRTFRNERHGPSRSIIYCLERGLDAWRFEILGHQARRLLDQGWRARAPLILDRRDHTSQWVIAGLPGTT